MPSFPIIPGGHSPIIPGGHFPFHIIPNFLSGSAEINLLKIDLRGPRELLMLRATWDFFGFTPAEEIKVPEYREYIPSCLWKELSRPCVSPSRNRLSSQVEEARRHGYLRQFIALNNSAFGMIISRSHDSVNIIRYLVSRRHASPFRVLQSLAFRPDVIRELLPYLERLSPEELWQVAGGSGEIRWIRRLVELSGRREIDYMIRGAITHGHLHVVKLYWPESGKLSEFYQMAWVYNHPKIIRWFWSQGYYLEAPTGMRRLSSRLTPELLELLESRDLLSQVEWTRLPAGSVKWALKRRRIDTLTLEAIWKLHHTGKFLEQLPMVEGIEELALTLGPKEIEIFAKRHQEIGISREEFITRVRTRVIAGGPASCEANTLLWLAEAGWVPELMELFLRRNMYSAARKYKDKPYDPERCRKAYRAVCESDCCEGSAFIKWARETGFFDPEKNTQEQL